MGIRAVSGFPRYVIEEEKRRFTGGGVSSSIGLALELVARLLGHEAAEAAQLTVQYAPNPPVRAGDPCQEAHRGAVTVAGLTAGFAWSQGAGPGFADRARTHYQASAA